MKGTIEKGKEDQGMKKSHNIERLQKVQVYGKSRG